MLRSMMDKRPVDPLLSNPVFSPDISPTSRGPLHPGATWKGVQRSGRNSYDVCVKFDSVDVSSGALTGTLEIKGLTPELESLVTFFEGEIIGETGPGFLTNKYGATELDDMRHWRRFPPFTRNRLEEQMIKPNLNLRGAVNRPYLFMRWKERFVVPRDLSIHGASFAGIYYASEIPTPKSEVEPSFAALSLSPPTTPPSEAPQLPPIPSLASVPLLSSPLLVTSQRGTRLPEEEWPVPSSPPQSPTSPPSMRRRSSIAPRSQALSETRRGRSGSEAGASLWVGEDETYGLRSWTDATITGFYHYRNSEPYQEISLRYVPTTQGSSQTFTFR
ncbi:hypothetical protein JCM21900_001377 [Sporobolomyces salmonicolor]